MPPFIELLDLVAFRPFLQVYFKFETGTSRSISLRFANLDSLSRHIRACKLFKADNIRALVSCFKDRFMNSHERFCLIQEKCRSRFR